MSQQLHRDYAIGDEIGRGKFGIVRRCVSVTTGSAYAVKSVDKSSISDPLDLDLVQREAKLTGLVSGHPNVISVHDAYEDDSSVHIVLDLCSGSDLYDRITAITSSTADEEDDDLQQGFISEDDAAALMRPLMEAIAHCHRRGVAHRDIKPDNVLLSAQHGLVLADFGSAAWFGDGRDMEGLVGTPYYVAPEVVAGRPYTEKIDVWSAGVILYIMLSGGMPPFYGDSAVEIFQAVLRGNLRFPTSAFRRGISSTAKDLLRKMICKDVSRRLSAEQVLRHPWMATAGEQTCAMAAGSAACAADQHNLISSDL